MSPRKVDIVIFLDESGSMSISRGQVQDNLIKFVTYLDQSGLDAKMILVSTPALKPASFEPPKFIFHKAIGLEHVKENGLAVLDKPAVLKTLNANLRRDALTNIVAVSDDTAGCAYLKRHLLEGNVALVNTSGEDRFCPDGDPALGGLDYLSMPHRPEDGYGSPDALRFVSHWHYHVCCAAF